MTEKHTHGHPAVSSLEETTFRVNRWQAFFNPMEACFGRVLGTGALLYVLCVVILAPEVWLHWFMLLGILLVFGAFLPSVWFILWRGAPFQILAIRDGKFGVGLSFDKPTIANWIPAHSMRVGRGLFGTSVITTPSGHALIVPHRVIPYKHLMGLLRRHQKTKK